MAHSVGGLLMSRLVAVAAVVSSLIKVFATKSCKGYEIVMNISSPHQTAGSEMEHGLR